MLRVAAYTGGRNVPSARFRVRQYVPEVRRCGVEIKEYYPVVGSYPPRTRSARPFWAALALGERLCSAIGSYRTDVTLLQREMLSTLLTAEPLTHGPRVLDVDDAIFLHRDGSFARRLARLCDLVICGNQYLAEHFERWNPNVRILPTAVDTDRFTPASSGPNPPDGIRRIGWSGTSSGFPYLQMLTPALQGVLERHRSVILRVVADRRPRLDGIPDDRLEYIPWSPGNEVPAIQGMTIGIMPLEDSAWARGKCSFKLLTYMSCGVPVVASPVGMNSEVLAAGDGLAARNCGEWHDALDYFLGDEAASGRTAMRGRAAVLERYSLLALAPRFAELLISCGRNRS